MAKKIQLRRDTAANWTRINPKLAQGEIGVDLTNKNFKIGDGVSFWSQLSYAVAASKLSNLLGTTFVSAEPDQYPNYTIFYNNGINTVNINPALFEVQSGVDVSILSDTESEDNTTGALVVAGGVGIGGNLNVVGDITANSISTTEGFRTDLVGNVTGNVTGNLTGDIYSSNGTKILDSGTDGTNATFIGQVTGTIIGVGQSSFTRADISSGYIDNTIIGSTTASSIIGTTIKANTGFIGDIYSNNGS